MHLKEVKALEPIHTTTQVLVADDKRLHVFQTMHPHADAATCWRPASRCCCMSTPRRRERRRPSRRCLRASRDRGGACQARAAEGCRTGSGTEAMIGARSFAGEGQGEGKDAATSVGNAPTMSPAPPASIIPTHGQAKYRRALHLPVSLTLPEGGGSARPMNFGLTPEQEMVVSTVRGFVETELYPLEPEVERAGHVPREMARGDPATRCMALGFYARELSRRARRRRARHASPSRCSSASSAAPAGRLPCYCGRPSNILMACERRAARALPAAGDPRREDRRARHVRARRRLRRALDEDARARRDGADWVLNGTKHFISHADAADFVIVFAATGEEETARRHEEAHHRLPGRPRHAGLRDPARLRLGVATAATTTRS